MSDREILKANFPSNSRKERTESRSEEKDEKKEDRRVEKVISGKVVRQKKSLGKKFLDTFIAGNVEDIGSYIVNDVLIPVAKDTLYEVISGSLGMVSGSVETLLFGEKRKSKSSRDRGRSYVSYNNYSSRDKEDRRDTKREISSRSRARHNFDDIILETRGDAEDVLDHLVDLTQDYDEATVADFYDLVGVTGEYTDRDWGWTDLRSASVTRARAGGYMLNLPKPTLLK